MIKVNFAQSVIGATSILGMYGNITPPVLANGANMPGLGRDWYMAMGKVEGKLSELGPDTDRSAYFICTLALAWPDGHYEIFEGRVQGSLTWPPRGLLGFGYDPVFVPEGRSETFAELDPQEKHAMSHRADAFRKLVAAIFS